MKGGASSRISDNSGCGADRLMEPTHFERGIYVETLRGCGYGGSYAPTR